MRPRLAVGLLALGVALLPLLAAVPAQAVTLVAASAAADPPAFNPSASKPRSFMLNILGSVLGGAMPNKWRAEQLANQHRYNFGWESLEAQFGTGPSAGPYTGPPDSYDDYIIKRQEQGLKGGTAGKPMTAPATTTQKFVKGAGGAVTAVTGFSFGTMIGNGAVELFGIDADGAVCSNTEGVGQALVSMLSGTDCAAYNFDRDYIPNLDSPPGELLFGGCTGPGAAPTGNVAAATCRALYYSYRNGNPAVWTKTQTVILTHAVRNGNQLTAQFSMAKGPGRPATSIDFPVYTNAFCYTSAGVRSNVGGRSVSDSTRTGAAVIMDLTLTLPVNCAKVAIYAQDNKSVSATQGGWVYVEGSPLVEAGISDGNPDRQLTCSITGSDGVVYTKTSAETYTEEDAAMAAPECPTLPEGVAPANVQVDDGKNTLYDEEVTPAYLDWWNTYPECRDGSCKLDLIKIGGQYPTSCFDLEAECDGWFADPQKPAKYECHYGLHTVDLDECNAYAGVFSPERILAGAPYSDPMTGEWSGGVNAPSPDRQAMGQGVQDPAGSRACTGLASEGFDPVAFVMRPVQCALEWAFVPRQGPVNVAVAGAYTAWRPTLLGQLQGFVVELNLDTSVDGCSGVTLEWPFGDFFGPMPELRFGDACPGTTLAPIAQKVALVLGILATWGALVAETRIIGGVVNYGGIE